MIQPLNLLELLSSAWRKDRRLISQEVLEVTRTIGFGVFPMIFASWTLLQL